MSKAGDAMKAAMPEAQKQYQEQKATKQAERAYGGHLTQKAVCMHNISPETVDKINAILKGQ